MESRYKKKSLKFCNEFISRDIRQAEALKARESSRFKRLSLLRDINDNEFEEEMESPKPVEVQKVEKQKVSRLDMLFKWKQEKELKKKLEMQSKKKPFYVGRSTNQTNSMSNEDSSSVSKSSFTSKLHNASSFYKTQNKASGVVPTLNQARSIPMLTKKSEKVANSKKPDIMSTKTNISCPRGSHNSSSGMKKTPTVTSNLKAKGVTKTNGVSVATNQSSFAVNKPSASNCINGRNTRTNSTSINRTNQSSTLVKKSENISGTRNNTKKMTTSGTSGKTTNQASSLPKLAFAPNKAPNKSISKLPASSANQKCASLKPGMMPVPTTSQKSLAPPKPLQEAAIDSKNITRRGYCFKRAITDARKQHTEIKDASREKLAKPHKEITKESFSEDSIAGVPEIYFGDISIIKRDCSFAPSNFKFRPPDIVLDFVLEDDIFTIMEQTKKEFMARSSTPCKSLQNLPRKSAKGYNENEEFNNMEHLKTDDNKNLNINNCEVKENYEVIENDSSLKTNTVENLNINICDVIENNHNVTESIKSSEINNPEVEENKDIVKTDDNKNLKINNCEVKENYDSSIIKQTENLDKDTNYKVIENDSSLKTNIVENLNINICDVIENNHSVTESTKSSEINKPEVEENKDIVKINVTEDPEIKSCDVEEIKDSVKSIASENPDASKCEFKENNDSMNMNAVESLEINNLKVEKNNSSGNINTVENLKMNNCEGEENDKSMKINTSVTLNINNCKVGDNNESITGFCESEHTEKLLTDSDSPFNIIDLSRIDFEEQLESFKLEDKNMNAFDILEEPQCVVKPRKKSAGSVYKRVSMLRNVPTLNSISEVDDCIKDMGSTSENENISVTPRRSKRISGKNIDILKEPIPEDSSVECSSTTPRRSLRLQKAVKNYEFGNSPVPSSLKQDVLKAVQRRSLRLISLNTPEKNTDQQGCSKTDLTADFEKMNLADSENLDPNSFLIDFENSPGSLNLKSRKVSLLYTPEKVKAARKSIRGDLMSFSPSQA